MRRALICALVLGACATHAEAPSARTPFSLDALMTDARTYIASHYTPGELPAALVADLTAAGLTCTSTATVTACSRIHEHTGPTPPCFYVDGVYYYSNGSVRVERDAPRCMGGYGPNHHQ